MPKLEWKKKKILEIILGLVVADTSGGGGGGDGSDGGGGGLKFKHDHHSH